MLKNERELQRAMKKRTAIGDAMRKQGFPGFGMVLDALSANLLTPPPGSRKVKRGRGQRKTRRNKLGAVRGYFTPCRLKA